ncbi:MAG: PD-(D/E)XK nuclease family protein [Marinicella sp.]
MNDEIETVNKATIESFIVNNYALSQIEAYLNRFNPIKIMKMENMEIRHSSILSWLLNPRENHGLHDEFLRTILAEVLKNTEKESEAVHWWMPFTQPIPTVFLVTVRLVMVVM